MRVQPRRLGSRSGRIRPGVCGYTHPRRLVAGAQLRVCRGGHRRLQASSSAARSNLPLKPERQRLATLPAWLSLSILRHAGKASSRRRPFSSTLGCAWLRCRCLSALLCACALPYALRVPSAVFRGSPHARRVALSARLRSAATCGWRRRLHLQLQFTASAHAPYFGLPRFNRFQTPPRRLTYRSTRTRYGKSPWPRSALCHHPPRGQGASPSLAAYLNVRLRMVRAASLQFVLQRLLASTRAARTQGLGSRFFGLSFALRLPPLERVHLHRLAPSS